MYCIYGKNKVGQAVAKLCEHVGIAYEMVDDSDSIVSFDRYEAIIPSPGVPGTHPIYATGKVLAELDFAYQFLPEKFQIVSITGTDGKSTTAWITYNILQKEFGVKDIDSAEYTVQSAQEAKKNPQSLDKLGTAPFKRSQQKPVYLSGNFDIPFSATVLDILQKGEKKGIIVIEISSFMSYWLNGGIDEGQNSPPFRGSQRGYIGDTPPNLPYKGRNTAFQSDYTIFTNLKSDHLNWHRDLQEYMDAKMSLVQHTTKKSIINEEVIEFAREKELKLELPENVRVFGGIKYEVGGMKEMNSHVPVITKLEPARSQNGEAIKVLETPIPLSLCDFPLSQGGNRDRTDGEDIVISGRKKYKLSETQLTGFHNAMNLLSVGLLANEMGICSKRMKTYFAEIAGLPHRLEKIGEKNGITFVEDSKSTSSQSLEAALGAYAPMKDVRFKIQNDGANSSAEPQNDKSRNLVSKGIHFNKSGNNLESGINNLESNKNLLLVVGGSDKGDTFVHLAPRFHDRVKAMVAIGATKEQFLAIAKQEAIPHLATDSLDEAVQWLYAQGSTGDVLMLSPGCASFGLFHDYLDRANRFREAVKGLK